MKGVNPMCTAISWLGKHHFFGRNLDLEYAYKERITISPRKFPFHFRKQTPLNHHYAMIGTATIVDDFPLYYEATNEMGLSIAGLNFPGNAVYQPEVDGRDNIAPFELIPWILGQCNNVDAARQLLERINVAHIPFSDRFPLSPLHWIIADRERSIVLEAMEDGVHVYDDPVGVLTNNPPLPYHLQNLSNYMALSPRQPEDRFSNGLKLKHYSNGMGGIGLPGDLSSASRFVRAAFLVRNSVGGKTVERDVSHFFHLLQSVMMSRGIVIMPDGRYEITLYSSCCDTDAGIYYYVTYDGAHICAVDMHREDLDSAALIHYSMHTDPIFHKQN
jgi:choloylglycine hydrolase